MLPNNLTKYVYKIRCRNGAIVENLQILGLNEEEANRKLQQMYIHSTILEVNVLETNRLNNANFEDVLDLLTDDSQD